MVTSTSMFQVLRTWRENCIAVKSGSNWAEKVFVENAIVRDGIFEPSKANLESNGLFKLLPQLIKDLKAACVEADMDKVDQVFAPPVQENPQSRIYRWNCFKVSLHLFVLDLFILRVFSY